MLEMVLILGAVVVVLAIVLARRGSSGGGIGHNTPGGEAHGFRNMRDSSGAGGG